MPKIDIPVQQIFSFGSFDAGIGNAKEINLRILNFGG
jgi:hypothetical protein